MVLNQAQINMFSYEQAMAVTPEQRVLLSDVQQTALSMVLTPWENRPLNFRGNDADAASQLEQGPSHNPLHEDPQSVVLVSNVYVNVWSWPAV